MENFEDENEDVSFFFLNAHLDEIPPGKKSNLLALKKKHCFFEFQFQDSKLNKYDFKALDDNNGFRFQKKGFQLRIINKICPLLLERLPLLLQKF